MSSTGMPTLAQQLLMAKFVMEQRLNDCCVMDESPLKFCGDIFAPRSSGYFFSRPKLITSLDPLGVDPSFRASPGRLQEQRPPHATSKGHYLLLAFPQSV